MFAQLYSVCSLMQVYQALHTVLRVFNYFNLLSCMFSKEFCWNPVSLFSLCGWCDNGSRGLFRTRKCNPPLLEEFNLILPNTSWHRSEKPLVPVLCLSIKDCSWFTYSCHFMKGKSCDLCYHFLVDSIRKQENSSWCYSTQEMSFNPRISVNKQVLKSRLTANYLSC